MIELGLKKGFGKVAVYDWRRYGGEGFGIYLHKEGAHKDNKEDVFSDFIYVACEAAARAYLMGLADVEKGDK